MTGGGVNRLVQGIGKMPGGGSIGSYVAPALLLTYHLKCSQLSMTIWEYIAQYLGIGLSIVLIVRLLSLRLHAVYRVFGLLLLIDLSGSVVWLILRFSPSALQAFLSSHLDYRVVWTVNHLLTCAALVTATYLLLGEILKELPGILRFSRKFLNGSFIVAAAVAVLTMKPEYSASGYSAYTSAMEGLMLGELIIDRAVSTVVFLVLLSILCFLLWFPITTPRNLAVFIIGFTAYAAGNVTLLLVQSLWLHRTSQLVSLCVQLLTCGCLAFWLAFITNAGESVSTKLRYRLSQEDQNRLLHRLDIINESLLRAAER